MSSPIVSIILNNYNYGRFLAAAVDSALAQTYSPCEVIVVDDGSVDDSQEVLSQYQGRVRIILQKNSGQTTAMGVGFAASSGDLVLFLDSDDALFPDAIERAVNLWEDGASKIQFPLEILNPQNQATGMLRPRVRLSRGDVLQEFLKTGRYITPPTSGNLYSRVFLKSILPIPTAEWDHGDAYFNTCAPFFGKILACDSPLGLYRVHGESMSSITHGGSINIAQMEKLMRHAMAEKTLLERLARERGLVVSKNAVIGHWLPLKMSLSYMKLTRPFSVSKARQLAASAFSMAMSILKSNELTAVRKLQNIAWAFGVALLPMVPATKLIRYAYDSSPQAGLLRLLRRA